MLFIGDSLTEGVGYPYEETFVGIVGEQLRDRGVEVLNAGVVSYSPIMYLSKVRHLIEHVGLEIDEVVLFLDISDIENETRYFLDEDSNVRRGGGRQARPT